MGPSTNHQGNDLFARLSWKLWFKRKQTHEAYNFEDLSHYVFTTCKRSFSFKQCLNYVARYAVQYLVNWPVYLWPSFNKLLFTVEFIQFQIFCWVFLRLFWYFYFFYKRSLQKQKISETARINTSFFYHILLKFFKCCLKSSHHLTSGCQYF